MPQTATIKSLPAAFRMMKAMQAEDVEWGEDYRGAARRALAQLLEGRMAETIDRHLEHVAERGQADRRNGCYRRGLLTELDTTGGVRLLGVGVSGLADWIQDDLFGETEADGEDDELDALPDLPDVRTWVPGLDVVDDELGRGWVWGAGRGIVTVRFETAETPPGLVRSLSADDPALSAWRPA